MATWKKIIVSGSNISQLNNDAGYVTNATITRHNSFATASFSGTNLLADSPSGSLNFASSSGQGLTISANAGNDTLTFGLAAVPNASLANSSVTIGSTSVSLGGTASTVNQLTLTNAIATGSFTGSFTGIANLPDLTQGTGITAFTYDGQSTANISISGAAALSTNNMTRWSGAAFINSSLTDNGTVVSGASSVQLTGANSSLTGSFTGSFTGVTNLPDLTAGAGISTFTYDGATTANVAVSGAATLVSNRLTRWSGNAFITSSLSDSGTVVSGASSIQLTGATSSLTGSFTGSFRGDGSQLTGIATTLRVTGSAGNGTVSLANQSLSILGTANEVETSMAGQTLTIGLPDDVVIGQDLTVSRNLTVLGTASFQNTTNLDVADRFIRLASGSSAAGDGGIAIQQTANNIAETFGFDSGTTRWGVTSSFDASQNAFTPDAFMALSLTGAGTSPSVPARYSANGNIFIGSDESIWIYS